ncbi:hypothetical protein B0H11DRAFT_1388948 [Mycena galericulata]|nr:hypothetical protein B0H11DRAFT_1388948 [Mycena galericulata]
MDSNSQAEPEFTTETSLYEDGVPGDRYTGAFFPRAKEFTVAGGTFQSITHIHQVAPSAPQSDFRVIPMGDLNLLRTIRQDTQSGLVHLRRERASPCTRRIYTARIHGSQTNVTAAVYEGDGAEEQWRAEISRYSELRHPYLLQLHGIVSTGSIHVAIFQDDLISPTELLKRYPKSHLFAVFFWASVGTEFAEVTRYIGRNPFEYSIWIRPSTGRLCLDLSPDEAHLYNLDCITEDFGQSGSSVLEPPEDWEMFTAMPLHIYHRICGYQLIHLGRWKHFSISTIAPLNIGSVRHFSGSAYEGSFEIASAPSCADLVGGSGWAKRSLVHSGSLSQIEPQKGISIIENGWIRCCSFYFTGCISLNNTVMIG